MGIEVKIIIAVVFILLLNQYLKWNNRRKDLKLKKEDNNYKNDIEFIKKIKEEYDEMSNEEVFYNTTSHGDLNKEFNGERFYSYDLLNREFNGERVYFHTLNDLENNIEYKVCIELELYYNLTNYKNFLKEKLKEEINNFKKELKLNSAKSTEEKKEIKIMGMLREEELIKILEEHFKYKKEIDAICSEYIKLNLYKGSKINKTCKEYGIPPSSIVNEIFNLFEDYKRLKEEEKKK